MIQRRSDNNASTESSSHLYQRCLSIYRFYYFAIKVIKSEKTISLVKNFILHKIICKGLIFEQKFESLIDTRERRGKNWCIRSKIFPRFTDTFDGSEGLLSLSLSPHIMNLVPIASNCQPPARYLPPERGELWKGGDTRLTSSFSIPL